MSLNNEEFVATIIDDGQRGAQVQVMGEKPAACPGLGGWKGHQGIWITWIKGAQAEEILFQAKDAPEGVVTITMEGDRIKGVEI